ncbi:MAG: hypothetical protein QOH13_1270 [Thermoleophilaceae bacterium]|nr:hypothetical protein [Thermoleophilaceae bacterium]
MGILDDAIREHLELKRAHGASDDEVTRKEAEAFGPVRQDVAPPPLEDDATQMLQPPTPEALEAEPMHVPAIEPDPDLGETVVPGADAHATAAYSVESEPLEAAPVDPYAVHPGEALVPDPHDHAHEPGSDPAWAEDTEFFADPPPEPVAEAAPAPAPDQPAAPQHHDEPHPALHDHESIQGEEYAPEPVFRAAEAPNGPEAPIGPGPVEDPPVGDPPVEEPPVTEPGEEDVLEETPEFLQDAPEHDRLWFEQKPPRDFDFGE